MAGNGVDAERGLIAGRYRVGERLGRGGMGTVWRAHDELLGRQVAVKEVHLDEGLSEEETQRTRERTLREARTVAQVAHPNILVLHDVVEQDGRPWIVMELIDGRSLAEHLAAEGPVEPREAARIGLSLLAALRAAHARGVQHRDIKPANVLLESGTGRVVLTDFGIARVSGLTTISETGGLVGSPEYIAPERMSGARSGAASDLWSLGVLLCAAVEGETPFHRQSLANVVHAVALDDIRLPGSADPLLPVVRGLLERDPGLRMGADDAEALLRAYGETGRMPRTPPHPETVAVRAPDPRPGQDQPVQPSGQDQPAQNQPAQDQPGRPQPGQALPGTAAEERTGTDGRAGAPAGRRPGRSLLVAAVLVAAVAGGGVTAGVVLHSRDGSGGTSAAGERSPAAGGRKSARPEAPGAAESPASDSGDARKKKGAGGPGQSRKPRPSLPPAPAGYRTVDDPLGFRLTVPKGFTRSLEPPRVFYYSPGKKFRIGIHIQDQEAGGSLGAMRASHAEAPDRYPGYRQAEVRPRVHGGSAGALWEFTWNGEASDGGPRHTYDQSWDVDGKMYDVWVSAPLSQSAKGKRYFDAALHSFVRTRPR